MAVVMTDEASSALRAGAKVLVSGGSSGLGAAVAELVRQQGGEPLVVDRQRPETQVRYRVTDLTDARAAEDSVRELAEEAGGLDAVVACAGTDCCGRLLDVPAEDWDRVVLVNLLGTAAVVRAALPYLAQSHGRIVTVASTLGVRAVSDATAYCASKFGVVGFTRALAVETKGQVGVTLLVPGGMDTSFFDSRPEQYRPPPDVKLADPFDVARAVLVALAQPRGLELRELVVMASEEPSWP
jgi:NAD(P)-dependent dehydrogenase (short-subunit alcohol dehydrogenase family)